MSKEQNQGQEEQGQEQEQALKSILSPNRVVKVQLITRNELTKYDLMETGIRVAGVCFIVYISFKYLANTPLFSITTTIPNVSTAK